VLPHRPAAAISTFSVARSESKGAVMSGESVLRGRRHVVGSTAARRIGCLPSRLGCRPYLGTTITRTCDGWLAVR
jgi:hypothetical protein